VVNSESVTLATETGGCLDAGACVTVCVHLDVIVSILTSASELKVGRVRVNWQSEDERESMHSVASRQVLSRSDRVV
jgi:hypothetical protein